MIEYDCPYCGKYCIDVDLELMYKTIKCPKCHKSIYLDYDEAVEYDANGDIIDEYPIWTLKKVKK